MLRQTTPAYNTYLGRQSIASPISVIRSKDKYWTDPERLIKHKIMYFLLGVDQQPLRRTSVVIKDREHRLMSPRESFKKDITGFRRARDKQTQMWLRRMQYQEYLIQHIFTRHTWGLLRKYPPNGAKIKDVVDDGYFGETPNGLHHYTRQPLPFPHRQIYPPRK
eukprot:Tbor_TRINITY_DN1194_c0_g1::TRINITY_DN1194_c0_g1_i1::g.15552::m.15552